MKSKAFYTTFASQGGVVIKFAEPPGYQVQDYQGRFNDPSEAKREFTKLEQFSAHEYLGKALFEQKVRQCQADLARLRSWNIGGNH